MYHMAIVTDSGLARTVQLVVWDSSSLNGNNGTNRRVGNTANKLILESTVLCMCRLVGMEFTGVGKPQDKPKGDDDKLS